VSATARSLGCKTERTGKIHGGKAPVLYPNHPKVGLRWLARSKDTAHGLLPQAEEAPSWKWANPEETGSPQGSWALAIGLQRVFPLQWASTPYPSHLETITLRDGRFNVVSVLFELQVQMICLASR
jgi:hypothetical protein